MSTRATRNTRAATAPPPNDHRRERQRKLAARNREEGLKKYQNVKAGTHTDTVTWKRFESYARENQLPLEVQKQKIVVDTQRLTVDLPVNGYVVPFHVNTLRSVVKQDEGEYAVLRFLFLTPGALTARKEDQPFEDPDASFIRSLTYRSLDQQRFADLHRAITELKKTATKREQEQRELADVVAQAKLIENTGKRVQLTDVQVRPWHDARRQAGDVEIHKNGIRYRSVLRADQKLDILFSNIKHLFFQSCDHELNVILHIHLKTPIVIGKRKTFDVQFFREVSESAYEETGGRKRKRNMHDEDELEEEQEERRHRALLDRTFKAFGDKIAEASEGLVELDSPFRELGFQGVPHRAGVLLQPTAYALVYLSETPFVVLTLSEIEIAHLERVQFGLRNFDLVFVFKDFTRPPFHINTIPVDKIDLVKDWLDSSDILFSEGAVNLMWPTIMKTVNDDPLGFFESGGWSFLGDPDDDSEDEGSSEEGSVFEASSDDDDDEDEDESEFSEEEDDSGSAEPSDEDDEDVVSDEDDDE